MNILKEINDYMAGRNDENYELAKAKIGEESFKKVRAILDILETGESSIAHSKLILHICEDLLDRCSLTLGTRRDV